MSVNNYQKSELQRRIEDCKKAFMLFDQDKNGEVTTEEIGTVLRNLGLFPTEGELQQMLREIDLNGDGKFSLNEFVELMEKVGTLGSQIEDEEDKELKAAFKVFNRSGSGFITENDLKSILNSFGEYLTNDESKNPSKILSVKIHSNIFIIFKFRI